MPSSIRNTASPRNASWRRAVWRGLGIGALACLAQQSAAQDTAARQRRRVPAVWVPRFGGGYQRAGYAEVGVACLSIRTDNLASEGLYTSLEASFPTQRPVYGLKLGVESCFALGMVGVEVKELTDFSYSAFVFTPRIGLGLAGMATLAYGYNIQPDDVSALGIGTHQVALLFNLRPRLWRQLNGTPAKAP